MLSNQTPVNNNPAENGLKMPNPWAFRCELGLAALAIAAALIYSIWPFLSTANDKYPYTIDALGHLTKIKYVADCLINLKWPSWFPYMDNGSMALQYGSPFSRILLAPVQMLTNNVMVTLKIGIFLAQFIGGLGVWYTCRRFVGPWVGIIGGVLYSVQPMLLTALLNIGEVAQIPMYAITPWYLCFCLLLFEKPTPLRWLSICISAALMILTHAMSALLICIALGVIILVLLIRHDVSAKACFLWFMAMGLAAGIECFWGIPSLTHLEHPLMPLTMPELVTLGSGATSLFNPALRHARDYYAGCIGFILVLGSLIQIRKSKWILPLFIAMLITIYLSFGVKFSLFHYIPMSQNFIPRKFLNFSVMAAVILNVFLLKDLFSRFRSSKILGKTFYLVLIACITILLVIDINPRMALNRNPDSFAKVRAGLEQISVSANPFEQGRFSPLGAFPSWYYYFAMVNGLNSTHGNSTSSPYSITNVQYNIAVSSQCPDYIVKNLLNWNTRYVYLNGEYEPLRDDLLQHGFYEKKDTQDVTLISPTPSSYFMRQQRDSIAIGLAAAPLVVTFPWLVQGESATLENYMPQYLDKFKLIYLIEPDVKDFKKFQQMVFDLLDAGKTVVVSMGNSKVWPLAGIIPYWENIPSDSKLMPTDGSPFKQQISLDPDPYGQTPAMGNLDVIWMQMEAGTKHVPAIGYKNVNGHRLYFVGLSLDKQLNATARWSRGYQADISHSKEIASLFEQIMDISQPNKNIVPEPFPVYDERWGHDSFSFKYKSDQPVSVLVSITHSLHWKGKLDSSPLNVQQLENLILLDLPAGEHQVAMNYGMTWVGWLGMALSIFSILIVILIYFRFEYLHRFLEFINLQIRRAVEGLGA